MAVKAAVEILRKHLGSGPREFDLQRIAERILALVTPVAAQPAPAQARCLITGVVLIVNDIAYNGDLFEQGDQYIVNCNEQSAHKPDMSKPLNLKFILLPGDFWERRGVFVVPKHAAYLSLAALDYIKGAPDAN